MMELFSFAAVLGSTIEIVVFFSAGFLLCRRYGTTFAEAVCYAIVTTLMLLSLLFQLAMVTGWEGLFALVEIISLAAAAGFLWRSRSRLSGDAAVFAGFWKEHPLAVSVMVAGGIYMISLAMVIPLDTAGYSSFSQLEYVRENNIWTAPAASHDISALYPFNHTALAYMFLRAGTTTGVNLFGLMAYVAIINATYALARRYAWPPTALTVSLVVMSMPRLVYLATTPGDEIIPVAVGLFCLLAVYRSVERLNINELLLLLMGTGFAASGEKTGMIFPAVLLGLSWILIVRRHGSATVLSLARRHRYRILAAIPPILLFSQLWLVMINAVHGNDWLGSQTVMGTFYNQDGLQGALANAVRYTLESFHLTLPVERFCREVLGFSMVSMLQGLHGLLPGHLAATAGAAESFVVTWAPGSFLSWFGPFGFVLVFPAVAYAVFRGPRRLKAVAVALIGYFYLVALVFAWAPGNARHFSLFFGCSGFCIAFLLPPWRLPLRGKQALQVVCVILFVYALTFNTARPLFQVDTAAVNTGFYRSE